MSIPAYLMISCHQTVLSFMQVQVGVGVSHLFILEWIKLIIVVIYRLAGIRDSLRAAVCFISSPYAPMLKQVYRQASMCAEFTYVSTRETAIVKWDWHRIVSEWRPIYRPYRHSEWISTVVSLSRQTIIVKQTLMALGQYGAFYSDAWAPKRISLMYIPSLQGTHSVRTREFSQVFTCDLLNLPGTGVTIRRWISSSSFMASVARVSDSLQL